MAGTTHCDSLLDNVRSAVAAELTTLPVYLYPYWSLKSASDGGSSAAVAARSNLMSVILEEMLHMGLSSNLLNALGGTPSFTAAPYLPTFPGHLLRSVDNPSGWGAAVDLLPMGTDSIAMLLAIELPADKDPGGPTLGEFYNDYIIACLPDDDSAYQGGKQLPTYDNPGAGKLYPISSKATATQAAVEVIDQGEGLSSTNHNDGDHELAHYWRFEEINQSITSGALNPATDVYPVIASPTQHLAAYSADQVAANTAFNTSYSRMLDAIEQTLMSDKPDVFPVATNLMGKLEQQATALRALGNVPGTEFAAGPTFDYVPA